MDFADRFIFRLPEREDSQMEPTLSLRTDEGVTSHGHESIKNLITSILRRRWHSPLLNYSLAVFLSGSALLLTMLMDDARIEPSTHLFFIAAVAISSWYGGLGPGLVATLLTAAGNAYFYHHIGKSPYPNDFSSTIHFVEFVIIGLLISVLNAARLKEQRRTDEARADAEAANRVKDEFLAAVSHDLRTPLTSIRGWARILRTHEVDEATSNAGLLAIERGAEAQEHLIKDLLDVSRIAAGKIRLELRPVDLAGIIKDAHDVVAAAAAAKGTTLNLDLDTTACSVLGDSDRLQQVIWNLLSNAIKFTPQGGRVEVRLIRRQTEAEITVSDTGVGISSDFLPHIFESFRQAPGRQSRGGLGLGLSIVRHFVQLQGGTVHAASEGEGRGSNFTVSLPLIRALS
jgi:signal transduction histidine kinase